MAIAPLFPLDALARSEVAKVCDLDGPPQVVHRMREMGLREGVVVEMIRPGQPCVVRVENKRYSFRCDECQILVEKQCEGECPLRDAGADCSL